MKTKHKIAVLVLVISSVLAATLWQKKTNSLENVTKNSLLPRENKPNKKRKNSLVKNNTDNLSAGDVTKISERQGASLLMTENSLTCLHEVSSSSLDISGEIEIKKYETAFDIGIKIKSNNKIKKKRKVTLQNLTSDNKNRSNTLLGDIKFESLNAEITKDARVKEVDNEPMFELDGQARIYLNRGGEKQRVVAPIKIALAPLGKSIITSLEVKKGIWGVEESKANEVISIKKTKDLLFKTQFIIECEPNNNIPLFEPDDEMLLE